MMVADPSIEPMELTSCSVNSGMLSSITSMVTEKESTFLGTVMSPSVPISTRLSAVNFTIGSVSRPVMASLFDARRSSALVLNLLWKTCLKGVFLSNIYSRTMGSFDPSVTVLPEIEISWAGSTFGKSLSVMLAVASKPATESVSDSVPSTILSSTMGMRASKDETPFGTVSWPLLRKKSWSLFELSDKKEILAPRSTSFWSTLFWLRGNDWEKESVCPFLSVSLKESE